MTDTTSPSKLIHGRPGPWEIVTALDEATVLQVASALEDAAGFVARPEKWW